MGLMDVEVAHAAIGVARVSIDLGGGHKLFVTASYDTDRYTEVRVEWRGRPRRFERLLEARLDQREGNAVLAPLRRSA